MSEETTQSTETAATDTAASSGQRPGFLKVLCILSFIGTGIGLIWGIMNYFTYKAAASLSEGIMEGAGDAREAMDAAMGAMGIDMGAMATSTLIVALLNIVIFFGVLQMWKMKKTGFYIYTAGQVISIIVPFAMVGGGALGGMMLFMGAIFPIAFIIMYGLNLKHMS